MIVHYLRVANFCGISQKEISPRIKGITIIEGPNETGKSCFVHSLYLLLEELDSSTKKAVLAIQPVDKDVGPEVEAEIETGPYRFRLFKRFIKDKATVLTIVLPVPGIFKGREAHNRVQEILNETLDMSLWKALNVIQGEDPNAIPTNSSLSRALSKAAGSVPVEDREMNLYELIKAEKEKYYSSRGPIGDLKRASDDLETLKRITAELQDGLKKADHEVEECSRFELQLLDLHQDSIGLEEELIQRKRALDQARTALGELQLLEEKKNAASSEYERIAVEVKNRNSIKEETERIQETIEGLDDGRNLNEELNVAEETFSKAKNQYNAIEQIAEDDRQIKDLRQKDIDHLNRILWLAQLKERLERVERAKEKADDAVRILENNTVTEAVLVEISEAHSKLLHAKEAIENGLPSIELNAQSNLKISVDKEPLVLEKGGIQKRTVEGETLIEIPKKLTIKFSAGIGQDKISEKYRKAEDRYKELLEQYHVKDLKEAYLSRTNQEDARRRLNEYETSKETDLRDLVLDEMKELINRSEKQINEYLEKRSDTLPLPNNVNEARELLNKAEEKLSVTETRLKEEDRNRVNSERARDKLIKERIEKVVKVERAEGELNALKTSLENARKAHSDEELATLEDEARSVLQSWSDNFKQKKSEADKRDVPTLELLHKNAKEALDALAQRIDKSKESLDGARGRLGIYEEQGIAEKLSLSEAKLSQEERQLAALTRQAEAARLLFETMDAEKLAAQREYMRPLKERIERLGRILYNDSFQVILDENLNIESRILDGKNLPFNQLSTGAKEQIGMINKLACALIVSSEGGVPLILDDALGHTDPSRSKAMNAILKVASQDCQIILMTCYPSRYIGIGDAMVDKMEAAQ